MEKTVTKEAQKTMKIFNRVMTEINKRRYFAKPEISKACIEFLENREINRLYEYEEIQAFILRKIKRLQDKKRYALKAKFKKKVDNGSFDISDIYDQIPDKKRPVINDKFFDLAKGLLTGKQFAVFQAFMDCNTPDRGKDLKAYKTYNKAINRVFVILSGYASVKALLSDYMDNMPDYAVYIRAKKQEKRKAYNTDVFISRKAYHKIELQKKGLSKGIEKLEAELEKACQIPAYDGKVVSGDAEIEKNLSKLNWRLKRIEKREFSICTGSGLQSLIPIKPERKKHNFSIASRSAHPAIYLDRKMDYKSCLAFPVINPYQGHPGIDNTYNPLRYVPSGSESIKDIINQDIKSCQINIVSDAMGHYQVRPVRPYGFWLPK